MASGSTKIPAMHSRVIPPVYQEDWCAKLANQNCDLALRITRKHGDGGAVVLDLTADDFTRGWRIVATRKHAQP